MEVVLWLLYTMLPPSSKQRAQVDPDEAVRTTDDDAAASRLYATTFILPSMSKSGWLGRSAVNLGYLNDPFVSHLYRPKYGESSQSGSRKPPLINVGTHHRTWAIDLLVDQFLEKGGRQIVSLGAGSDTRFWRLMVCQTYSILLDYLRADCSRGKKDLKLVGI